MEGHELALGGRGGDIGQAGGFGGVEGVLKGRSIRLGGGVKMGHGIAVDGGPDVVLDPGVVLLFEFEVAGRHLGDVGDGDGLMGSDSGTALVCLSGD